LQTKVAINQKLEYNKKGESKRNYRKNSYLPGNFFSLATRLRFTREDLQVRQLLFSFCPHSNFNQKIEEIE